MVVTTLTNEFNVTSFVRYKEQAIGAVKLAIIDGVADVLLKKTYD
jgi:hypothetical protein